MYVIYPQTLMPLRWKDFHNHCFAEAWYISEDLTKTQNTVVWLRARFCESDYLSSNPY